jgi:two-component sensor histidine kinase
MSKRRKYLVPELHILTWAVLLFVPILVFHNSKWDTGLPDAFFYISNVYHIGLFYFNAYYLYPRLLTRKRWPFYILALVGIIIATNFAKIGLLQLFVPGFEVTAVNQKIIFFPTFPFLFGSIIFRLIIDRVRFEKAEKEAKAEKLSAELKFLRSQVSPHFLFNVLTNLVSLARQQSKQLEPALIHLSELMRYMLYETDAAKLPAEREIEHLQYYIELQKLRFGDDVRLTVDIKNEVPSFAIEPMLLIPFVENAFKHGIGLVKDPFITIRLEVQERLLYFTVSNNYNRQNGSKDSNSGIGLANVQNRLKLLYGDHHTLQIKDTGDVYTIVLKLTRG